MYPHLFAGIEINPNLIAISVAVYYPFFKVYEKNTLDHEGE